MISESQFCESFRKYFLPLVRFFCRKGVVPEENCEDLAQKTFVRAYRGLDLFRGEAEFKTWLFTIARSVLLNHQRGAHTGKRKGFEVSVDEPGIRGELSSVGGVYSSSSGGRDPLAELLSREQADALRDALQSLPRQMRGCVLLKIGQDLTNKEIAAVMRISRETVGSHLFQARKRLKTLLKEQFSGIDPGDDHGD